MGTVVDFLEYKKNNPPVIIDNDELPEVTYWMERYVDPLQDESDFLMLQSLTREEAEAEASKIAKEQHLYSWTVFPMSKNYDYPPCG